MSALTSDIVAKCKAAWAVTETCVRRWAQRGAFAVLIGALTASVPARHFKFLAEDAVTQIELPEHNPWGIKLSTVRQVYSRMATYTDAQGTCWCSVKRIARDCDLDMRTVRRAQGLLRAGGWLASFRRWKVEERDPEELRRSNVHVLLLSPDPRVAADRGRCWIAVPEPRRLKDAAPADDLPTSAPSAPPIGQSEAPEPPLPPPTPTENAIDPYIPVIAVPLERLYRVTGVELTPEVVAPLLRDAGLTPELGAATIGELATKAGTGIAAGEDGWRHRPRLLGRLGGFINATLARASSSSASAPASSTEPELSAEERRRRYLAEEAARERREEEERQADLKRSEALYGGPRRVRVAPPEKPPE